jgi:hypothetical protein
LMQALKACCLFFVILGKPNAPRRQTVKLTECLIFRLPLLFRKEGIVCSIRTNNHSKIDF